MTRYCLTDRFETRAGDALAGFYVRLLDKDSGSTITIYADENDTPIATVSGVANQAKTDANGNFTLFVVHGIYSVEYLNSSGTRVGFRRYVNCAGDPDAAVEADAARDEAVEAAAEAVAAAMAAEAARDVALAAVEVLEDDAPLFGLVPDATYITNPSGFTSGGNTFTAPAGKFTSADIGKLIYCTRTGSGYTTPILPVTTITAVSGTTVTTTATWTEAYSGGISYELVWGTDNDAALVQMGAYAVAKRIMRWPAGGIILRKCYIDIGSIDMPFAMRGAGIDATTLFLATGFDFSTTNAHAFSSMLVKSDAIARDEDYRGFFGDFTVRGPLHKYASATSYNGLAQVWNEGSIQNVHIENLHGVYADIRCQAKTSLFNVRCKQALEGGTHGIMSVAPVTGYQVHTGNCSGSGLLILNVSGDATFAQDPVNFVNSLFDECDGNAVTVENSGGVQFIGCSMFGGPNTVSWALEVKTSGSVVSLIGSQATGYGTASPRKAVKVGSGTTLNVLAGSKIHRAGDGTGGESLNNAGTVTVDGASTVGPNVTNTGTINYLPTSAGQPLDATLTALAGLATGADKLAYSTGTDTFSQTDLTSFARTLLDDANAASARTTLAAYGSGDTLLSADGTVSLPGSAFASDTDTGFYRPSANVLGIVTGGVERIRVGSNGAVHFGGTSPLATYFRITDLQFLVENAATSTFSMQAGTGGGSPKTLTLQVLTDGRSFFDPPSGGSFEVRPGGTSAMHVSASAIRPGTDNTISAGTSDNRYSVVYAGTGTINTSDEREKSWRGALTDTELAAARKIATELGFYQWAYSVASKGADGARLHVGVRAQRVWSIMAEHGLVDPIGDDGRPTGACSYAFLCFDQFDEGDRYSIRVDQLALFLLAAQEQRLVALEAYAVQVVYGD